MTRAIIRIKPRISPIICLILLLAFGAIVHAAPKTKLTLGHLPVTGHISFFVAKEEGFFDAEGLDINLVEFQNSADGINALRSGKLDLGAFGTTSPLANIANGANLRIIGGVMGEDAAIVAKKDKASQYKTIQGFKGKRVATVRLSTGDAVWRWALDQAKIDWKKDLKVFELKSPAAVLEAVKSGDVDAGVVWGPHDLRAGEFGLSIVARTQDYFPKHPCCRLVVNDDKGFAQNRAAYVKFEKALVKAQQFVETNHKKTLEDLRKYVKLDLPLLEEGLYGGHVLISADPNTNGIVKFWDTMNKSEFISSSKDIKSHIDTSVYRDALKALVSENGSSAYYKKLQKEFEEDN